MVLGFLNRLTIACGGLIAGALKLDFAFAGHAVIVGQRVVVRHRRAVRCGDAFAPAAIVFAHTHQHNAFIHRARRGDPRRARGGAGDAGVDRWQQFWQHGRPGRPRAFIDAAPRAAVIIDAFKQHVSGVGQWLAGRRWAGFGAHRHRQRSRDNAHAAAAIIPFAGKAAVLAKAGAGEIGVVFKQAQLPSAFARARIQRARGLEITGVKRARRIIGGGAQRGQLLGGEFSLALGIAGGHGFGVGGGRLAIAGRERQRAQTRRYGGGPMCFDSAPHRLTPFGGSTHRVRTAALGYHQIMQRDSGASLYEFFAGGGLARLGLEPEFQCVFANDLDPGKAAAYTAAFGADHMRQGDIWGLSTADLPGHAALAWASFPCQDLSLAGARGGLDAPRSGAFWGFHKLIAGLIAEDRAPALLALENVSGLLTSRGGADFTALVVALGELGYRVGALEINAAQFVPQSRPRLFIIAIRTAPPRHLIAKAPSKPFHTTAIEDAVKRLPEAARAAWIWWRLPTPPLRNTRLADVLDDAPDEAWDAPAQTEKLLAMMSPLQRARIENIRGERTRAVGALFKRIRMEKGARAARRRCASMAWRAVCARRLADRAVRPCCLSSAAKFARG